MKIVTDAIRDSIVESRTIGIDREDARRAGVTLGAIHISLEQECERSYKHRTGIAYWGVGVHGSWAILVENAR